MQVRTKKEADKFWLEAADEAEMAIWMADIEAAMAAAESNTLNETCDSDDDDDHDEHELQEQARCNFSMCVSAFE